MEKLTIRLRWRLRKGANVGAGEGFAVDFLTARTRMLEQMRAATSSDIVDALDHLKIATEGRCMDSARFDAPAITAADIVESRGILEDEFGILITGECVR